MLGAILLPSSTAYRYLYFVYTFEAYSRHHKHTDLARTCRKHLREASDASATVESSARPEMRPLVSKRRFLCLPLHDLACRSGRRPSRRVEAVATLYGHYTVANGDLIIFTRYA